MPLNRPVFEKVEVIFDDFEWDDEKQEQNYEKHEIDFDEAIAIFTQPFLRIRSDRSGELRFLAIGNMNEIIIAVAYTERNGICRVISARQARRYERKDYYETFAVGPQTRPH